MNFIKHISEDKQLLTKLDVSDIPIEPNSDLAQTFRDNQMYFMFNTRSYNKLDMKTDAGWSMMFSMINEFLNTLSYEQQIDLAITLGRMHRAILDWFQDHKEDMTELNQLVQQLGQLVVELDDGIGLCDRLRQFVLMRQLVVPATLKDAGSRAQDSEALTFNLDEVTDLTVIALLCKLFSPIFSTLMRSLNPNSKRKLIDTPLKEVHCCSIFTPLFDLRYQGLVFKLEHYIEHIVKQQLTTIGGETSLTLYSLNEGGYDTFLLTLQLKSLLITRQLVNIDFNNRTANLMAYIYNRTRDMLTNAINRIRKRPVFTRNSELLNGDGDGNMSQLELDSMTSKHLCDVPMLITVAVEGCIARQMELHGIPYSEYEQVLSFYQRNPIVPNPINQMMCNIFYGDDLGGGRGVAYLKSLEYTQLVVLLQMILLHDDAAYQPLAHALTMRQSSESRRMVVDSGQFSHQVGSNEYYRRCKDQLTASSFGPTAEDWEAFIKKICDHLLLTTYVYNTAPWLWNWLEQDNLNGKIIPPQEITVVTLCEFYDRIQSMQAITQL